MKQVNEIESNLSHFLLRDVVFLLENGKTLKKGKLVLFKFKEFHFVFTIKNHKNETRVYEIPYPFSWKRYDNSLKFSYSLEDLTGTNRDLYYKIRVLNNDTKDKFYDSSLVLSAV